MMIHQDLLDEGKIEELVSALHAIDPSKGADLSRLMPELNLFNWIDGVGMFLLLGLGGISTLRRDIW